jgi:acetyl esterase
MSTSSFPDGHLRTNVNVPARKTARMLHPQARFVLDTLEALGDPPLEADTPEQSRQRRLSRLRPPTEPIHESRDLLAGSVPARLYRPRDDDGLGLLVYFHGGGWVVGNLETHENTCRGLANASGHAVLSVDYRLAPEHPFPAGLEDSVEATRWAAANAEALGCDPRKLAVGGDSAGGNYAAIVSQLAPVPLAFQLLVYPATDARCDTPSVHENADGYFLTLAAMKWFYGHYLCGPQGEVDDPRVSPILADDAALRRSPPTLVITAGFDPLRDEGEAYAARLAGLGVPTTLTRYAGMFHGFFSLGDLIDDGQGAIAQAGRQLALAFARTPVAAAAG